MSKKKDKSKPVNLKSYNKRTLENYIVTIFQNVQGEALNYKQIAKKLDIKDDETKKLITTVLYELVEEGKAEEVYTGKFRFKQTGSNVTGTVEMTAKGSANVIADETGERIFISIANMNRALQGDRVKVYVYARSKNSSDLEGEISEIIERANVNFVGVIELSRNFAFLICEGRNMPHDIFVPLDKIKKAKNGDKVIAKITEWPANAKNPIGEVVEVLGRPGDNEVEMHAILAEFGLPLRFPPKVEEEADHISDLITHDEIAKRRDFRKITTITIDPEDAKDFDDALSIQKLENGNWEIGVHIADVTHYVERDSLLDKEALVRGTSVYLVDRVVPMLPEKLSNFVCSLRPNEDKLTFSAVFEIDNDAHVVNQWFGKTIIRSCRRFSYDEVKVIIDNKAGELSDEILVMNDLAQKLKAKRFKKGAISFNRIEVKFKIDEKGKPLSLFFKSSNLATQLIEEFMLLANQKVAEFIGQPKDGTKGKTFVYRVHDEPDMEKLANFSKFIKRFGYSIEMSSPKAISSSLNSLLSTVNGKNEQDIVENLAVRSMAKAMYSTKNIGHYGLAFSHYSHFTSPIRRYPDMMAHWLLERYLKGGSSVSKEKYEKMCKQSSDMEQRAAQAERASTKYKQVEFMQDKIGEVFEGVISSVTDWGLYVEIIENRVEGMIPLRDLGDDFYVFDEANYCIIGKYNKRKFQLGDKIKVQIAKTNLEKKQLDFALVDDKNPIKSATSEKPSKVRTRSKVKPRRRK